ncbi:PAS domain-containing sensor histidine kinase [Halorubellus sp. PRR65]|uniref:sensor histidine kinase n=1 Tax=Halorubellus sp. PRR65 TaxID=3098148 RepID=UPI002B25F3D6|nr:PAS domain-containing sensor histidine kinase [Halorubellus sp. PRR65]
MTDDGGPEYLVDVDEAFLRALVQRGSDVVLTIDADSRVVFTNDTIEDVLGYAPGDVVGEPLTTVMPERFQDAHHAAIAAYLESGDRSLDWSDIRLPAEHADGHEVPLDITFHEHVYDGKRYFSGIMKDVTAQVEYENRLRALQETTQALMDETAAAAVASEVVAAAEDVLGFPLATVFVPVDGTWSDAARTTGAGDDPDAGSDRGLVALESSDRAEAVFEGVPTLGADSVAWSAFRAGETRTFADVREAEAAANATTPVRAEVVLPLGSHGVLVLGRTDPGEPDEDEVDLAKVLASATEAALDRVDRERRLRERERELERQNERLEAFASVVSHDLRDPLNAAAMQVELLRANDVDNEYVDRLEDVHDRMATLVDDVLSLARDGRTVGDTEPVDVAAVALDAWETAGAPAASLSVADDLGRVDADPERLRTILENLLGNAVHHAGDDVAVTVGALADDPGFFVADDGPGIPERDRETVFEHGHTESESGTGLGLAIVRSVAGAHGWQVDATESDTGGARFDVRVDPDP